MQVDIWVEFGVIVFNLFCLFVCFVICTCALMGVVFYRFTSFILNDALHHFSTDSLKKDEKNNNDTVGIDANNIQINECWDSSTFIITLGFSYAPVSIETHSHIALMDDWMRNVPIFKNERSCVGVAFCWLFFFILNVCAKFFRKKCVTICACGALLYMWGKKKGRMYDRKKSVWCPISNKINQFS